VGCGARAPRKKIAAFPSKRTVFTDFSSSFFTVWPKVACSLLLRRPWAERLPSMQHAAFSAAACLPLGHYLTLPVRLACNLQPLAASAEQRRAFLRPPPTHALVAQAYNTLLRFRCCMCFCMLRCSMLLPAAERRPTVTPTSYLEGRKCSFPLYLLLLFWWCHNQSCSPS